MLKQLSIQNIILIERATLSFQSGLNILTGETGSGKSAIMHGLALAMGERGDTSIIRHGCDKGVIEAIFDTENPHVLSLLIEGGIDHECGQELIIRREISFNGKGRIFINNQSAQLSFLRKLGIILVQIVGQHANQNFFLLEFHRKMLDLYGDLSPLLNEYQKNYDLARKAREELDHLIQQEAQRLREIQMCQRELEELEEAQCKEGEEEELFAEYTLLINSEELSSKVREINDHLFGERFPLIAHLNRHKQSLEVLENLDPFFLDISKAFQNLFLELQEIGHSLRQYQNRIHFDADRLSLINERLTLLNRLKRKYGNTVSEILNYQNQTIIRLKRLENADNEIETLQLHLLENEKETERLALELTQNREKYGILLEKTVSEHLHSLNMSSARFIVQIQPQKRNRDGGDRIEFFLRPNIGEHQVPLKEGASGGEISRVLLALQTLLAGKEKIGSLVFDEIDANIGGETATIIGDKLKQISRQHQVICITHFPQVASQADHHLQILKEEKEGRTITRVEMLNVRSRQNELARMAGLKAALKKTLNGAGRTKENKCLQGV